MTIYRSSAVLLLLAGCATGIEGPGQDEQRQAKAIGADFCAAALQRDEGMAVRLMTSSLRAAIAGLQRFDAGWRARNPGEKPPLGDGLRLTAWPDRPEGCTVGAVTSASVSLAYAPKMAPDAKWEDRLLLVRGPDGRLMVDDIRFDPAVGGSLRRWIAEMRRMPG